MFSAENPPKPPRRYEPFSPLNPPLEPIQHGPHGGELLHEIGGMAPFAELFEEKGMHRAAKAFKALAPLAFYADMEEEYHHGAKGSWGSVAVLNFLLKESIYGAVIAACPQVFIPALILKAGNNDKMKAYTFKTVEDYIENDNPFEQAIGLADSLRSSDHLDRMTDAMMAYGLTSVGSSLVAH